MRNGSHAQKTARQDPSSGSPPDFPVPNQCGFAISPIRRIRHTPESDAGMWNRPESSSCQLQRRSRSPSPTRWRCCIHLSPSELLSEMLCGPSLIGSHSSIRYRSRQRRANRPRKKNTPVRDNEADTIPNHRGILLAPGKSQEERKNSKGE